jgi:hypothetical protein
MIQYLIQPVSIREPSDDDCQVVRAQDNVRVYRGSREKCEDAVHVIRMMEDQEYRRGIMRLA